MISPQFWTRVLSAGLLLCSIAHSDDDVISGLEKAKSDLTKTKYQLTYKYQPGETLRYHLEHDVSVNTTISGNNQRTQAHTESDRSLRVDRVEEDGNIVFAHTIERIKMRRDAQGRAVVTYDSQTDNAPPPEFEPVAEKIGKPISTITMSPSGVIVDREDKFQHVDIGLGGLSIPFPNKEIDIGHQWSRPAELKVHAKDQRIKLIKIRELFTLEKVETGVATIAIKTQILTPVEDARVKAQLIQRISQGKIRFDIDAGRLLGKEMEWNERVLGFNGAESKMAYMAQVTERLAETEKVAQKSAAATQ